MTMALRSFFVALVLAAVGCAVPSVAGAAAKPAPGCTTPTPAGTPRFTVAASASGEIDACDHANGRRRTLRGPRSRLVVTGGVSVLGPRVAWVEARWTDDVTIEVLRRVDLRRAGSGTSTVVARVRLLQLPAPSQLGSALVRDGSIAWMTFTANGEGRLLLSRPSRPRRLVARGAISDLAVVDGGTLRWLVQSDRFAFADVLEPPIADGCPRRSDFGVGTTASSSTILVTEARTEDLLWEAEIRACLRGTGRDRVIGIDTDGYRTFVAGSSGDWLVVGQCVGTRYERVMSLSYSLNVRTMTRGRSSSQADGCDGTRAPVPGAAVAIAADGAYAWITTLAAEPHPTVVLAVAADGTTVELDRGPQDSLTDLAVGAGGFAWKHDGAARGPILP
jgi:hypothetical protein